jgi:predicted esterase
MIQEHHLAVTRTARFLTLGGDRGGARRQLWLACHGYGQLASGFLESLRALDTPERLVVAPEALSRFYLDDSFGPHGPDTPVGATWMTREDREVEIEDYVAYLERVYERARESLDGARPRVLALGFSQGVATVSRWAARTAAPLDELVLWGGRLPPELEPTRLTERHPDLQVTLVAGTRDRFVEEARLHEEEARLSGAGVRVRALTFKGGHRLDDATLLKIASGA